MNFVAPLISYTNYSKGFRMIVRWRGGVCAHDIVYSNYHSCSICNDEPSNKFVGVVVENWLPSQKPSDNFRELFVPTTFVLFCFFLFRYEWFKYSSVVNWLCRRLKCIYYVAIFASKNIVRFIGLFLTVFLFWLY